MKNSPGEKSIISSKKALRKSIQDKRDHLADDLWYEKSAVIAKKFLELKQYKESKNILAYFPFRSELDTKMIISKALKQGKNIILPRVNKNRLDLYHINDLANDLARGCYDIMEPVVSKCKKADPSRIDLAIVPGVGFDVKMNRLGYGGGFYDRLLGEIPPQAPKIALAFDLQIVATVPVSDHDLKVDALITEYRNLP